MGHHGGGGMQFSDFGRHGLMLDSEVYMHIVLRMLTWNQNCSRAVFATGSNGIKLVLSVNTHSYSRLGVAHISMLKALKIQFFSF